MISKLLYSSLIILTSVNKCENNVSPTTSDNVINNTKQVVKIDSINDNNKNNNYSLHLENIQAITNNIGEYTNPVWSPDGKKILYTSTGYNNLYYYDIDSKTSYTLLDVNDVGYNANWSIDSKSIYYRVKKYSENKKSYFEVYSIDIDTKKSQLQSDINPDGIKSYSQAIDSESPIIFINTKTLKVEAETVNKKKKWIITNDEGQFYNPILSPDKMKVLTHRGSDMLIFSSDGSGIISNIGVGIGCSWSRDNKKILYFLDESSNGEQITGSELYLINIDGTNKQNLTNTDDMIEMYPMFSPDNSKIVFSDEKTRNIYIADFIK